MCRRIIITPVLCHIVGHALGLARNALSTTNTLTLLHYTSKDQRCHIEDNFVDFREGNPGESFFGSRLLHPSVLNIKRCSGNCLCRDGSCHAEGTGLDITNHARFKGLLR